CLVAVRHCLTEFRRAGRIALQGASAQYRTILAFETPPLLGVLSPLSRMQTQPRACSSQGRAAMRVERPRAARYRFNVSALLTDLDSGQQTNGTTWDLSLLGCQVMVANFARVGARVRVQINYNGDSFEALGRVANLRPLMGVGIGFTIVEDRS